MTRRNPVDADSLRRANLVRGGRHVVIVGFGPIGRVLADALLKHGWPFTIIDLNPTTAERQSDLGRTVVLGDARQREVLEAARISEAAAVAITLPDAEIAQHVCAAVRAMAPDALIAIRTRHLSQAMQVKALGADITIVEEIETANAMEDMLTAALGLPDVAPARPARDRTDSAPA